jgi:hypothetical protein
MHAHCKVRNTAQAGTSALCNPLKYRDVVGHFSHTRQGAPNRKFFYLQRMWVISVTPGKGLLTELFFNPQHGRLAANFSF